MIIDFLKKDENWWKIMNILILTCIREVDLMPLGAILSMFLQEYKNFIGYMRKLWIYRGGNRYKFTGEYDILLEGNMRIN